MTNINWKQNKKDDQDIVEPFCGACLAIPFAFAGVGASAYGTSSSGKYKKQRKLMLWSGVAVTVISILIAIYYLCIAKCKDCLYDK